MAFVISATRADQYMVRFLTLGHTYAKNTLILTMAFIVANYVIARIIYMIKRTDDSDPLAWDKDYFRNYPIRTLIIGISGYVLTMTNFTLYKAGVIGRDGYLHDELFANLDRAIWGTDAWIRTHTWFPSVEATAFFDYLYHPAFLPMLGGYLVCATSRSLPAIRLTYMTSFIVCFLIIGMLMANAMSSAGPVYDGRLFGDGQRFKALVDRLDTLEQDIPRFHAAIFQDYLIANKISQSAGFGSGITAMPSMHVVMAFLWTLAGWHIHRILGVILTVYAVLIWLISVHLGWHYFVDGLVAIAMTSLIWYCLGRALGLYRPKQSAPQRSQQDHTALP
ncbi:phosphatase PAP2 family protein [Loktanella sp. S4079]|uniref:phosphatase PAP2 family protein n=1 Tax=Loktanella sp. S4079 TaxID=579483 RepID=UPI0005FA2F2E|nr:phosphatase PAP2 family protein [Loktanella sp. S4079]KJZ19140.1 hypothetical protein TW80_10070 [Loktanella sp. S4079]